MHHRFIVELPHQAICLLPQLNDLVRVLHLAGLELGNRFLCPFQELSSLLTSVCHQLVQSCWLILTKDFDDDWLVVLD